MDNRLRKRLNKEFGHDELLLRSAGRDDLANMMRDYGTWNKNDIDDLLKRASLFSDDVMKARDDLKNGTTRNTLQGQGANSTAIIAVLESILTDFVDRYNDIRKDMWPLITGVRFYLKRLKKKLSNRRVTFYVIGFSLALLGDIPERIVKGLNLTTN